MPNFNCEICGKPVPYPPLVEVYEGHAPVIVCQDCCAQLGFCNRCKEAKFCSFETDPSPLPKVVEKRIQKGPMISVVQVKNPARTAITCEKDCPCFDPEFGCLKEHGTCGKYEVKL